MFDSRNTKLILIICAVAWVVIVARAAINSKDTDDFVFTVTQDEVQAFAKDQLAGLQQQSFAEDIELCGIIFEDSEGNLGTTPVISGERASCDISYFDEPGMGPIASYHTHGSFSDDYDSEVPSVIDMESDIASGMDGYVSTPGGRFWRVDWASREAEQACTGACLPRDPAYQPCPADPLPQRITLEELKLRQSGDGITC